MKCVNCNKDFEPKRKTAKFCSSKCRVYFSRVKEVSEVLRKAPVPTEDRVVVPEDDPRVFNPLVKLCAHGFPTTFCKFAKPGKPCKIK